jgi:hypothetical protein
VDQLFTYSDFVRLAVDTFPDLAEEFRYIGQYPTLQVSAFAERMQRAKGAADWDGYERGVRVVSELWPRADHQLSQALSFTLMKALDFDGPRGKVAWDLLPPDLQGAWRMTRKHLDELTALPRKTKGRRR